MSDFRKNLSERSKWRWVVPVLLIFTAGLAGLVLWIGNISFVSHDPLFRGKPESEWIRNLKYSDNQQVEEWHAYGEDGVQVLIRGLEKANRTGDRVYRKFNRRLPASMRGWLPAAHPSCVGDSRDWTVDSVALLPYKTLPFFPPSLFKSRPFALEKMPGPLLYSDHEFCRGNRESHSQTFFSRVCRTRTLVRERTKPQMGPAD